MTNNVYRTAQGKMIDMGALTLQNEQVRAVGNMGVNARGDRVDETNRVIDSRASQVQRQIKRTTNVVSAEVQTNTLANRKAKEKLETTQPVEESIEEIFTAPLPVVEDVAIPTPTESTPANEPTSGLAAALAKAKK